LFFLHKLFFCFYEQLDLGFIGNAGEAFAEPLVENPDLGWRDWKAISTTNIGARKLIAVVSATGILRKASPTKRGAAARQANKKQRRIRTGVSPYRNGGQMKFPFS